MISTRLRGQAMVLLATHPLRRIDERLVRAGCPPTHLRPGGRIDTGQFPYEWTCLALPDTLPQPVAPQPEQAIVGGPWTAMARLGRLHQNRLGHRLTQTPRQHRCQRHHSPVDAPPPAPGSLPATTRSSSHHGTTLQWHCAGDRH